MGKVVVVVVVVLATRVHTAQLNFKKPSATFVYHYNSAIPLHQEVPQGLTWAEVRVVENGSAPFPSMLQQQQ